MFSLELIMALHLICLMFYQLITNSSPNPMGISTHPSAVSLLETLFRSFLALSGCGFFWVCCQTVPPQTFLLIIWGPLPCSAGWDSLFPESHLSQPLLLCLFCCESHPSQKGTVKRGGFEIFNGYKCLYSNTSFEQSWVGYRTLEWRELSLWILSCSSISRLPGLLPWGVASFWSLIFCRCTSFSLWKIFDPFFFFSVFWNFLLICLDQGLFKNS